MKVEYVSPFAEASISVFKALLQVTPERGELSVRSEMFTSQQINVVCGVTGDVHGLVILGMSMVTADRIASHMIGMPVITFDQLAASAIAELGNMICGNSLALLSTLNYACDITPPTIIRGTKVKIVTPDIPALTIPLNVPGFGAFEINVSLKESLRKAVAA
jgi:chemotaxis protein CheX